MPYNTEWQETEILKLIELKKQGMTDAEVGAKLGRTESAVLTMRHNLKKIPRYAADLSQPSNKPLSDIELEKIESMLSEGRSAHEIATELNRSLPAIYKHQRKIRERNRALEVQWTTDRDLNLIALIRKRLTTHAIAEKMAIPEEQVAKRIVYLRSGKSPLIKDRYEI